VEIRPRLVLDAKQPFPGCSRRDLITFVTDRPVYGLRYAIDRSMIGRELGWGASQSLEERLSETIDWYLANDWWWRPTREESYRGSGTQP